MTPADPRLTSASCFPGSCRLSKSFTLSLLVRFQCHDHPLTHVHLNLLSYLYTSFFGVVSLRFHRLPRPATRMSIALKLLPYQHCNVHLSYPHLASFMTPPSLSCHVAHLSQVSTATLSFPPLVGASSIQFDRCTHLSCILSSCLHHPSSAESPISRPPLRRHRSLSAPIISSSLIGSIYLSLSLFSILFLSLPRFSPPHSSPLHLVLSSPTSCRFQNVRGMSCLPTSLALA